MMTQEQQMQQQQHFIDILMLKMMDEIRPMGSAQLNEQEAPNTNCKPLLPQGNTVKDDSMEEKPAG